MYEFHKNGTLPDGDDYILVYGSNLSGRHGKGMALVAKDKFGAEYGKGIGLVGNSYGIPTKDKNIETLPLHEIEKYIHTFKEDTRRCSDLKFWVSALGTGLANYGHSQIAPYFSGCNFNCSFPEEWKEYIRPIYYTGIGSRETPPKVIETMRSLASEFSRMGFVLRSGAAEGADSAFEAGCNIVSGKKEIWVPWVGFQGNKTGKLPTGIHFELASKIHPAWEYLSRGVKALHARNTGQVLGVDLATASSFVLCYTKDKAETAEQVSKRTGGTGTAIKLASLRNIPVFNLANENAISRLHTHLGTI